jgi:hypothetical protein
MSHLSPRAERCANRLSRVLAHLRAAEADAFGAHETLCAHQLAPDAPGCVPDALSDLIGLVEATIDHIGARVPVREAA